MGEYREAMKELIQARNNFENAAPEFVDAAIFQLCAAEAKLDAFEHELNKAGKPYFRKRVEEISGPLTDRDYLLIMDITTDDIKVNRIMQGKRTTMEDAIKIAAISAVTLKRCG